MAVQSPCIGICRIDARSSLCEGCYRTVEEIRVWGQMAEADRQQLMRVVELRQADPARIP